MKYNVGDLDLDCSQKTKDFIEDNLKRIPASKIHNNNISSHIVGSYFCEIPTDKISGLASIDYKKAEEDFGYQKIDILHNTILDNFNTRTELENCLSLPTNWKLLYNKTILEQLPHINNYHSLLMELPPIDNETKLSFFLALIRPGKKYCIDIVKKSQDWDSIKDVIWVKENNGYQFKKTHSIAYSISIKLMLNYYALLEEVKKSMNI